MRIFVVASAVSIVVLACAAPSMSPMAVDKGNTVLLPSRLMGSGVRYV